MNSRRLIDEDTESATTPSDEKPLVEYFSGRFAAAIKEVPEEMLHMSEVDLHAKARPTPVDYKLRQNVHDRLKEARALGKEHISQTVIFDGVVSRTGFQQYILSMPIKVAWMIRPVVHHGAYYEAIMREGLKKIFEIMQNTPADPKYLPQLMKLTEKAADRVHGPVVQRIQMAQKQEITHVSGESRDVNPEDPLELEAKVREMQAKLAKMKPLEIEAKSANDED